MSEILILSAGRRVSLVRSFMAAARVHGLGVMTADMNPQLSSACHVSANAAQLPHVLSEYYREELLALCRKRGVRLIVPTIDTELAVLASLREPLAEIGCAAAVSDTDLIAVCRDKRRTAEFFRKYGLQSPEVYPSGSIRYPAIMKPYDGSLSSGIRVLATEDDFSPGLLANPKNIFCQYLSPEAFAEYTCDAYFDRDGEIRCVVPRLRIEVRGGEVAKGRTERNNIVPFLFDKLARVEGARGCLTIQIMRQRETGELYLIEINPRFGGGYPLTARSGAAYHSWLIDEYLLGTRPAVCNDWIDGLTMLRYDAEVFVEP